MPPIDNNEALIFGDCLYVKAFNEEDEYSYRFSPLSENTRHAHSPREVVVETLKVVKLGPIYQYSLSIRDGETRFTLLADKIEYAHWYYDGERPPLDLGIPYPAIFAGSNIYVKACQAETTYCAHYGLVAPINRGATPIKIYATRRIVGSKYPVELLVSYENKKFKDNFLLRAGYIEAGKWVRKSLTQFEMVEE